MPMPQEVEEIRMKDFSEQREEPNAPTNRDWNRFIQEWIRRCKIISAIGIILIVLIFIVTLITVYSKPPNVCRSNSCENTAKFMLQTVDKSLNPCKNFYEYACKENFEDSKLASTFYKMHSTLNSLINNIADTSPSYLKKLKKYYRSCIYDKTSLNDIKMKLKEIGEWPLLNKENFSNETELNWTEIIHRMYKVGVPANYFFSFFFRTDFKNGSKEVINLEQPDLGIARKYLIQGINDEKVQIYRKSMINAVRAIGANGDVRKEIEEVLKFQIQLANISLSKVERSHSYGIYYDYHSDISIGDLESKYSSVKWLDYINGILSPYTKVNFSETVHIASGYFEKFHDLMVNQKPPNRLLVNYAFLRMAHYLGIQKLIYPKLKDGKKSYLLRTNRRALCTIIVNQAMYSATSSLYVRSQNLDKTVSAVKLVSENVRTSFNRMIRSVNWLDNKMKNKILKKIAQMDILIGYPEELLDNTKLDEYYQDLDMPTGNYMLDLLSNKQFKLKKSIENFGKPYNKTDWTRDYGNVVNFDASYFIDNAVYLSGGFIHPLLFDPNIPNYQNYAIIGTILGHEIAHSLDTRCLRHDEYGNYKENWWDSKSTEIYLNKTKCIVEKYNQFGYPDFGLYVNGTFTLDENMSDINGLKVAYDAYIETTKNRPKEPSLPGFENFSNQQMFWIAFGSFQCLSGEYGENEANIKGIVSIDRHAPTRYRTIGSTSSLTEFAKDFNCLPTDFMNPPEKCSMWF